MNNTAKINNITGNFYSDEWYTDQKTVDLCWELLDIKSKDIVCCPFDSEQSLFVQKAMQNGNKVIYGMRDFIGSTHYEFTKLVTNPPFSIKDKVIETVYSYGKEAALILPLDTLGGVKRHEIYNSNQKPAVFLPTKRINYFDKEWKKKTGSNFHSIIMLFNQKKHEGLLWEFEERAKNDR